MLESNVKRGEIQYIDRAKQLILFTGLERMRGITPTDIDLLIDYGGKSFLYGEAKFKNRILPVGQRKALENLVKSHTQNWHTAVAIVFNHECKTNEEIISKDQLVTEVYFRTDEGAFLWMPVKKIFTVLAAIEWWENKNNLK